MNMVVNDDDDDDDGDGDDDDDNIFCLRSRCYNNNDDSVKHNIRLRFELLVLERFTIAFTANGRNACICPSLFSVSQYN